MGSFDLFKDGLLAENERETDELEILLKRLATDTEQQIKDEQRQFSVSPGSMRSLIRLSNQTGVGTDSLVQEAEQAARQDIADSISREARQEARELADQRRAENLANLRRLDRVKALEINGVSRLFEDFDRIPPGLDQRTKLVQVGVSDTGTAVFDRINVEDQLTTEQKKAIRAQEVADFLDLPKDLILDRLEEEQFNPEVIGKIQERKRVERERKADAIQDTRLINFLGDNPDLINSLQLDPDTAEKVGRVVAERREAAAQHIARKVSAKQQSAAVNFAKRQFTSGEFDPADPKDVEEVGRLTRSFLAGTGEAARQALATPDELQAKLGPGIPAPSKRAFLETAQNALSQDPFGMSGIMTGSQTLIGMYRKIRDEIAGLRFARTSTVGEFAETMGQAITRPGEATSLIPEGAPSGLVPGGQPFPGERLPQRTQLTTQDLLALLQETDRADFGALGAFFSGR